VFPADITSPPHARIWARGTARIKLRNGKIRLAETTPADVVAPLSAVAAHGLLRDQVGTVVELLDGGYEVEFSDDEGKTYAELAVSPDQPLVLHHRPGRAA